MTGGKTMEQGTIPPGVAGHNRSMVDPNFAVMPPEGILESRLPGWPGTSVFFQTSPQMGAKFAQALLVMPAGGKACRGGWTGYRISIMSFQDHVT